MQKLNSLQALRGLAALFVVIFHYHFRLGGPDEHALEYWHSIFGWSFIGVDIFFVISGFIMVYTTRQHSPGIVTSGKFLLNRMIRILPLYYLLLFFAFLLNGAFYLLDNEESARNLISALTFTVSTIAASPQYIDLEQMYNVRWTLNYELYFYLVFALCLLFRQRILPLLAWAAAAVFIIPALFGNAPTLNIHGYQVEHALWGFLSNPVILDFVVGALAGGLYVKLEKAARQRWLQQLALGLALVMVFAIVMGLYTQHLYLLSLRLGVAIGITILLLSIAEPVLHNYIPRIALYAGNISFSLYLCHNTVNYFVFDHLGDKATSMPAILGLIALSITLSLALSHCTWKYIEVGLTRWLKAKLLAPSTTWHQGQVTSERTG
ncbi:acyltransferase [Jejubacter calystegiae]|uniref:Acyltransferase n=1 Tax=Jejubacter calystegiae TaxID=2579935 RepID=A0A4P8YMS5_9ENTR|nr:acyltransferase [Jejubacter calystegiae]QCT21483.1 acyltransferase [Jejubacter calystegiae]